MAGNGPRDSGIGHRKSSRRPQLIWPLAICDLANSPLPSPKTPFPAPGALSTAPGEPPPARRGSSTTGRMLFPAGRERSTEPGELLPAPGAPLTARRERSTGGRGLLTAGGEDCALEPNGGRSRFAMINVVGYPAVSRCSARRWRMATNDKPPSAYQVLHAFQTSGSPSGGCPVASRRRLMSRNASGFLLTSIVSRARSAGWCAVGSLASSSSMAKCAIAMAARSRSPLLAAMSIAVR